MPSEPKVFVVNKSSHDYSKAEEFGELVFMTEGNIPSKFDTSRMYRIFYEYLKNSNSEDYILITGMNIMCSIASAMFATMHSRLNLLIYKQATRNKESEYLERILMMKGGETNYDRTNI